MKNSKITWQRFLVSRLLVDQTPNCKESKL